ncbi:restriction endonuclease [Pseudonocardia hydrocarbonoxydans]|uniref:Restriction endonuclease type IV Mrr domain-containing protein n=1 Tax=Pseudonocardia hydrocarbonoxydans TaxID=76726 RepID=A0A4Y3WVU0_9PSEU|nr:restriction endonuclease [Pseudonocardia hydrocarbonoxydans]GEC22210.1 hypothetical protein PHY01_44930 [Pseudonocardia hydrocarbonoxydans]
MPKRTTPFQTIVRLVREHFAQPGVTITESKYLVDSVTGYETEVDIVIEGELDGEPIVISVEVVERSRRAGPQWVRQMIGTHKNLPTNRLILVAERGFTPQALAIVESEAGRVQALSPEILDDGSDEPLRELFVDQYGANPAGCNVTIVVDGEAVLLSCEAGVDIYAEDGQLLGPLHLLLREVLSHPDVVKHLSTMAHNHPEREGLKSFSCGFRIYEANYYLQHSETGALHRIIALESWGSFSWTQTALRFALTKLGDRVYGSATGTLAGRPAVWVATTDKNKMTTKVSWQTTDNKPATAEIEDSFLNLFPAIRNLTFPEPAVTDSPDFASG